LSPVVRRIRAEAGISADSVRGTGPGGRITRDDALAAAAGTSAPAASAPAGTSAPAAAPSARAVPSAPRAVAGARDEVVRLSNIRRATGAHMVASLATSPHSFSVVEVDFANVETVRSRVREEFRAAEGFGLTYLPFVSRAVVDALVEFPHLNASVAGDELIVHRYVDLGIAVDLDGNGLLAPVVRDAETKRLRAIAREIRDLADRARNKQLAPAEIQGGTFTISNNGSAGSVLTMPIINQPQVAILSTDAVRKRPVVIEGTGDSIAIHPVGNLAMSWDHRAFDGAYAAAFLVRVKEILETRDWSSEV
jgi:2-oxoglutarate dehydrogenase E2 component (dihydrolipoamide succinyltransferase)